MSARQPSAPCERRFAATLVLSGAAFLLSALTFTLLYPLAGLYAEIIPNAIRTKPAWGLIERGVITLDKPAYLVAVVGLYIVYLAALIFAIRRGKLSTGEGVNDRRLARMALLAGSGCALILLWSYPLFSQDVFDYLFHTHEWVQYGASPFTHVPSQFSSDPLFRYVSWTEAASPYGPVWILLTAPLSWLAGDDLLLNLLLFKALTVLFYMGSAILLYLTLGKVLPRYRLAGTLLFAWNPLVLAEFAGSGHNDIVMLFFAMLAVWLLVNGRFALSLVALTVSTLIKVVTILALPLFLLYVWKKLSPPREATRTGLAEQRAMPRSGVGLRFHLGEGSLSRPSGAWRPLLAYILLCVGVAAVSYLPLWEGINSMAFLRRGDIIGGAPVGNVVTDLLAGAGLGRDTAVAVWKVVAWGGFVALFIRQAWVVWRGSSHTASQLPLLNRLNAVVARVVYGKAAGPSSGEGESALYGKDVAETSPERIARTSLSLLFFYAVVVSQYYQPWYLSWALVWAGFLLKPRYAVTVWTLLIFSAVAVGGYIYL